ncbi:hypothetical protein GCM10020331_053390 [Ectobacillus funiculus]
MRELNYQPSVVASVKKRIQTIGLLIPSIANPFMAEVARSIEDHVKNSASACWFAALTII